MAAKRAFLLRLPPDLWEAIKRWADHDLRSVNAQIEFLLREALRRHKRSKEQDSQSSVLRVDGEEEVQK